jgi:Putative zinc-finger
MQQSQQCAPRLRELFDTDLPADELERLAHVDALLRASVCTEAPCERTRAAISAALDHELSELESVRVRKHVERCASCKAFQADAERYATALRTAPLEPRATTETYELRLAFGELALIYKSLQAVRTLGALPPQDELLNDTMELVDQALKRAV